MPRPLTPCPHCNRHVLAGEHVCPFCDVKLPGLSRRALGALTAATLGLAVTGCPKREVAPKYGMPPQPAPVIDDPPPQPAPGPEPPAAPEPEPDQDGPPKDEPPKETPAALYGMPSPG